MIRFAFTLALAAFSPIAASAQDAPAPAFEAASVKPNLSGPGHSGTDRVGGSLQMTNVTLKTCITLAYGVTEPQVLGPNWLDSERYDIVAKADSKAPRDQFVRMLQSLLADRFKLALHRETRELSVYALVAAKGGAKLKKVEGSAANGSGSSSSHRGSMTAEAVPMSKLADLLAGPRFDLGHPVVDKTGLDGVFDFTLTWTPENSSEPSRDDPKAPPPIFIALQQQLGLKLEPQKAPVEVLVVDHAEKAPTEN